MTPRQERAIIRRVLRGDREAAEALVRAHQASLYAYMLRLTGRPEVAEDVVQEAFVRALTRLERFDPRFRFSTWLFTIAKRLYVNAAQRLAPTFDTDAVSLRADGRGGARAEGGAAGIGRSEGSLHLREALDHALTVLGEDQREAVVLYYQCGWSVEQIGQYLDQPEGTVKSHLHRARKRLRDCLEQHATHGPRVREALA